MAAPLLLALMIVATSALTAGAVLLIAQAWAQRAQKRGSAAMQDDTHGRAAFVFHDRRLLDCNTRGQGLLATARGAQALRPAPGDDLEPLLHLLTPHFPGLRDALAHLAARGALSMTAADDSGLQLDAEWRAGLAHIHVTDTRAAGSSIVLDRLSFDALEAEVQSLRQCTEKAPFLIWHQDTEGAVTWANGAYLDLAAQQGHELVWPLPALFPPAPEGTARLCLQIDGEARWFARHSFAIANGLLHYALPVVETAQKDRGKRDLMQTLAGAFATHQVGLAVFDRARVLQIFNPALVDMTGLEPEFLAARPRFDQVLHCLRERRLLPEPADYRSWRNALLEMERAAETGAYHEEWALPSGQTFHVTGRPHPDGGIAFLFEDVTSEVTLTRSFRAQIETAQTVIDALPQAMAVFSPQGTLTLANAAYHRLWGTDPEEVAARINLHGALQGWRALSQPSPLWDALSGMTDRRGEDGPIRGTAVLRNGQILSVQTTALEGRNTLITFDQRAGTQRFPAEAILAPQTPTLQDAPPLQSNTMPPHTQPPAALPQHTAIHISRTSATASVAEG